MTPQLRCAHDELPDLAPPWRWIGSRHTGWSAVFGTGDHVFMVEASVIADDGIQICASVDGQSAYAPLVVILAVAMANDVDLLRVDEVALAESRRHVQAIEALSQRCADLARESASFEARWREVGEHYAAERASRHAREAADSTKPSERQQQLRRIMDNFDPGGRRRPQTTSSEIAAFANTKPSKPMTIPTKTSHFFLRNHEGHRIGVVALRYYVNEPAIGGAGVTVAVSLCHDNDPWRSSTGVAAARGRLDASNLRRADNVTYKVADHCDLRDDVFRILTPSGIEKRNHDVDWAKMQALFERQWVYLTTPKAEATE